MEKESRILYNPSKAVLLGVFCIAFILVLVQISELHSIGFPLIVCLLTLDYINQWKIKEAIQHES